MIGLGRYRIGRRGAFLALFGVAYLLIGQSLLGVHDTRLVDHVFRFALAIMPITGYGWLWLTCGAIALLDGLWPRGTDTPGFVAAVLAPVVWSIVYLAAWLQEDTPLIHNLWETSLLYAVIAAAVLIVAGMPEPRTVRRVIRHSGTEDAS